MPEFRFRRKKKKQSPRRHTVHDAEEAHAQVVAAREMITTTRTEENSIPSSRTRSPSIGDPNDIPEPVPMATTTEGGHMVSTGTLAREREKFFELLRTKYPEHDKGVEEFLYSEDKRTRRHSRSRSADIETLLAMRQSSEDEEEEDEGGEGKRRRRRRSESESRRRESFSSSDQKEVFSDPDDHHHLNRRHYGCLFLRHGKELRRCPVPSPVTFSTLKNLLINTFDLESSLLDDPSSYVMIQDRASMRWKKLTDISDIYLYDHCVLQLADSNALATNPTHFIPHDILEDHTYSSSESPPPIISNHHNHTLPSSPPLPTPPSHPSALSPSHYNHSSHLATPLHSPRATAPYHRELRGGGVTVAGATQPSLTLPVSTNTTVQYGSPHSITSSTSGVCSDSVQMTISPQTISRHVKVLGRRVKELKEDYDSLRREQRSEMADFSLCLRGTASKIMAAIKTHVNLSGVEGQMRVEPFRRERLELTEEKSVYRKNTDETLLEVSILESAVEDIRRDVVDRRCRVHEREVDGLVNAVQNTMRTVALAKEQYGPLEAKLKRVMERELTDIVQEEKFLQDEFPRLEEASDKCTRLTSTLETLKQVAVVQFHRTPLVPYFAPVTNPDRGALLENIRAVTPNHAHRVESIEMAECVQHKKKELVMKKEGIKRFESQLRRQREHLHKMESTSQLEDRQAKKMIKLYLEEKAEREAELAKEIKLERKVAERKRKEERERVKERLKQKQKDEEKKKKRVKQQRSVKTEREDGRSREKSDREEREDWYTTDTKEENSLNVSSSFSSTASLLEHVRSMNSWSSDNNSQSQQDRTTSTIADIANDDLVETPKPRNNHTTGDTPQEFLYAGKAMLETSENDSSTVEDASLSETRDKTRPPSGSKISSKQSNNEIKREEPLHTSSPKHHVKKTVQQRQQQTESRSNTTTAGGLKLKKESVNSREVQPAKKKYESTRLKSNHQRRLNNSTRGVQSPTTGVESIFKANQTRGNIANKTTNQTINSNSNKKTTAQSVKQSTTQQPQRRKVPLNDTITGPSPSGPRRVASSDTLLEDTAPAATQRTSHSGLTHKLVSTGAQKLAKTPPKLRKSTGDMGDQVGIYDLLEKKKPATEKKRPTKRGEMRRDKMVKTPNFDPQTRRGGDTESEESAEVNKFSNSQPDNINFISNPSYETRASAKQKTVEVKQKPVDAPATNSATASNPIDHKVTANSDEGVNHSSIPPSLVTKPSVINTEVHPKTSGINPTSPPPINHHYHSMNQPPVSGYNNTRWPYNDHSDNSSETSRAHSDHSSTAHSNISGGRGSNSSGTPFSSGGGGSGHSETTPTTHRVHSHMENLQPLQPEHPLLQRDNNNIRMYPTSALSAPKRYHSNHHGNAHVAHQQFAVASHHPPHKGTNRLPMHTAADQNAITSYPRFQCREEHRMRLQAGSQPASQPLPRPHRTTVLPGTGQLTHVSKPHPNHAHHLQHHHNPIRNSRPPDPAGSLV